MIWDVRNNRGKSEQLILYKKITWWGNEELRIFYKPFAETLLVALKEQDIHVEIIINSNNMLYLPHCISSNEGTLN